MIHVVIVGAGIGGLTTALVCLQKGMRVTILEQAPELSEIGAGLQLSPNATCVMRDLGLLQQVADVAVEPISKLMSDFESGELIFELPFGAFVERRDGAPFYQIHRADMLDILVRAIPDGTIRLGAPVVGFTQTGSGVAVHLATGETVRGDVLVGADGIKSAIAAQMTQEKSARSSTGFAAWRSLIPADRLRHLGLKNRFYGWLGRNRVVFSYWVRSGQLFNFGGTVPSDEIVPDDWGNQGDVRRLKAAFDGAEPHLRALIDTIDTAFVTGLYYKEPHNRLVGGKVALVGDAAHAMVPALNQGACQAMEDAVALGRCLERRGTGGIEQALMDYQSLRHSRATRVQTNSGATGQAYLSADAEQIAARDGRFRGLYRLDPQATTQLGWLYGYDITKVPLPLAEPEKPAAGQDRSPRLCWEDGLSPPNFASSFHGFRGRYDRLWQEVEGAAPPSAPVDAGGVPARWAGSESNDGPIIIYLHPGFYTLGSSADAFGEATRIADAAQARLLLPDYRLAPEHPFPGAIDDIVSVYRWLLDQGHAAERIFLSGECAGAGLAIAATFKLRDAKLPLPAGIIATAPFADLTLRGATIDANVDPVLDRDFLTSVAAAYIQSVRPEDPLVSPALADLHDFPPMLIQAARGSPLAADAETLAEAGRKAGVNVTLHLYETSFHAFASFAELAEAEQARRRIGSFVRDVCPG